MKKLARIIKKITIALGLLLALTLAGLLIFSRTDTARDWLRQEVTSKLRNDFGLEASFDDVEFDFLPIRAHVLAMTIEGADHQPFVTADRVTVALSSMSLLRGELQIAELTIEEPEIHLVFENNQLTNLPEIRRPQTSDNSSSESSRPLSDLGILAGRVHFEYREAPGGPLEVELEDTNIDISFDEEGNPSARLLIADGRVTHGEFDYDVELIQGRVLHRDDAALLRDLRLSIGDVRVAVARAEVGTLAPFDMNIEGEAWAPLELIRQLPLPAPLLQGATHVTFDIGRREGELSARGRAEIENLIIGPEHIGDNPVTWGPHAIGTVTTDFDYNGERIACEEVIVDRLAENDGRLIARDLVVDLADETLPIQAEIEFDDMQLAHILIDAGLYASRVRLRIFGEATLVGRFRDFRLRFRPLELRTRDFEVLTASIIKDDAERVLAIPAARLQGKVIITPEGVGIRNLGITFGRSALTVYSDLEIRGPDKGFLLRASTPEGAQFHFEDIGGQIAGLPFGGQGQVRAHIEGPYRDPAIRGFTDMQDFTLNEIDFGHISGPINYRDLLISLPAIRGRRAESEFEFNDARVDFRRGGVIVDGLAEFDPLHIHDAVEMFGLTGHYQQTDGIAAGQAEVHYDSRRDRWQVDVETHVTDVSYAENIIGTGNAVIHYDRGDFDIEGVELSRQGATILGGGTIGRDGALALDIDLSDLNLSTVELLPEVFSSIDGNARGHAHIGGTTSFIRANGTVDMSPVDFEGTRLGPSRLNFALVGPELELDGGLGGRLLQLDRVGITLQRPYPIWIRGRVNELELNNFIGDDTLPRGMQVRIDGELDAGFDLERVQQALREDGARDERRRGRNLGLSGWASISSLHLRHPSFVIRNTDPMRIDFDRERGTLRTARFDFRSTELQEATPFILGGWASLQNLGLELRARGLALGFVPDLFDTVSELDGSLDVNCDIIGTLDEPALLGNASLRINRLTLSGLESYPASSLTGQLRFSRNVVLLEDLEAQLLGGDVLGSGRVVLEGLGLASYNLEAQVHDARLPLGPRSSAVLNGNVEFRNPRGEETLPNLNGRLEVMRLRYVEDIALLSDIDQMTRRRRTEVQTYAPEDDVIAIDLQLTGASNLRLENNLADAEILIDDRTQAFRLVGTNQYQSILGTLAFARHGQLNFRQTQFDIDRGILVFTDPFEFNPSIDFLATAVRRDWVLTLQVYGTRNNPTIMLTSDPPLSEEDIALLLTVGLTREETEQLGYGAAAQGALPELVASLTGLDRELNRLVPMLDELRITTDYSRRTGRAEPRVRVAQRLTRNVKVGASAGLSESRDIEANLEWRLGENLSLEAVYDNDQGFIFGNIGGDLRWRLEF